MSISLQYLIPLWGFSGAREKFEEMCGQLIKNEYPASERIRVHRGDGGIDAHVGALTAVDGIHVFQVRFFEDGLGDSQKHQIRESFRTAATSKNYNTRSWTLCLPMNLSIPEKTWFERWNASQATSRWPREHRCRHRHRQQRRHQP